MTDRDQIDVIQAHMSALREQNNQRVQSLNTIWRTLTLGIAALIVLGEKVDLALLPLVCPPLLMIIGAFFFGETAFLIRTGRCIASEETKINGIAGARLLSYESDMWEWRVKSIGWSAHFYLAILVSFALPYAWIVYQARLHPIMIEHRTIFGMYLVICTSTYMGAVFNLGRYWQELHPDRKPKIRLPNVSKFGYMRVEQIAPACIFFLILFQVVLLRWMRWSSFETLGYRTLIASLTTCAMIGMVLAMVALLRRRNTAL